MIGDRSRPEETERSSRADECPMLPYQRGMALNQVAAESADSSWDLLQEGGKPILSIGLNPPPHKTQTLQITKTRAGWAVKNSDDWRNGRRAQLLWAVDRQGHPTGYHFDAPGASTLQKKILWKNFVSMISYRTAIQSLHLPTLLKTDTPRNLGYLKRYRSTHKGKGPAAWGRVGIRLNLIGDGPIPSDEGINLFTNIYRVEWSDEPLRSPVSPTEGESTFVPPPILSDSALITKEGTNKKEVYRNLTELKGRLDKEVAAPGVADSLRLAKIDALKRKLHDTQLLWNKVIIIHRYLRQLNPATPTLEKVPPEPTGSRREYLVGQIQKYTDLQEAVIAKLTDPAVVQPEMTQLEEQYRSYETLLHKLTSQLEKLDSQGTPLFCLIYFLGSKGVIPSEKVDAKGTIPLFLNVTGLPVHQEGKVLTVESVQKPHRPSPMSSDPTIQTYLEKRQMAYELVKIDPSNESYLIEYRLFDRLVREKQSEGKIFNFYLVDEKIKVQRLNPKIEIPSADDDPLDDMEVLICNCDNLQVEKLLTVDQMVPLVLPRLSDPPNLLYDLLPSEKKEKKTKVLPHCSNRILQEEVGPAEPREGTPRRPTNAQIEPAVAELPARRSALVAAPNPLVSRLYSYLVQSGESEKESSLRQAAKETKNAKKATSAPIPSSAPLSGYHCCFVTLVESNLEKPKLGTPGGGQSPAPGGGGASSGGVGGGAKDGAGTPAPPKTSV